MTPPSTGKKRSRTQKRSHGSHRRRGARGAARRAPRRRSTATTAPSARARPHCRDHTPGRQPWCCTPDPDGDDRFTKRDQHDETVTLDEVRGADAEAADGGDRGRRPMQDERRRPQGPRAPPSVNLRRISDAFTMLHGPRRNIASPHSGRSRARTGRYGPASRRDSRHRARRPTNRTHGDGRATTR